MPNTQKSANLMPIIHPKRRFRRPERSWKRCTKRVHQNRVIDWKEN